MFGTLLPNSSTLLLGIRPVFVNFSVFLLRNFIIRIDAQNNWTGPIRFMERLHGDIAPPYVSKGGGGGVDTRGTLIELCLITQQAI